MLPSVASIIHWDCSSDDAVWACVALIIILHQQLAKKQIQQTVGWRAMTRRAIGFVISLIHRNNLCYCNESIKVLKQILFDEFPAIRWGCGRGYRLLLLPLQFTLLDRSTFWYCATHLEPKADITPGPPRTISSHNEGCGHPALLAMVPNMQRPACDGLWLMGLCTVLGWPGAFLDTSSWYRWTPWVS